MTTSTKDRTIAGVASDGALTVIAQTRHVEAEAAMPAGVSLRWVAPGDLLIDANVRSDANLTPSFLASIRDLGVLVPVVAVDSPEGLRVQKGQRRTLAAVEVGRDGIPVYVIPDTGDVDRIIGQLAENHDREAMTAADDAAAFQQLALLGLSAAQIAKRTRRTKDEVAAGITVIASRAATDALAEHALTLEDAALFAEFEDDEDATATLTRTARNGFGSLAHAAQRIRDARAEQIVVDALTATLTEAGVTIRRAPGYYDNLVKPLTDLHAKGNPAPLTAEQHQDCPGHVAWIDRTDEPVTVYGCNDYKAHGHLRVAKPTDPDGPARTPMTDEQKAERRRIIENNKAWRSAETVRRQWLATFAARKTAPKDGAAFIVQAMIQRYDLNKAGEQQHLLAAELLGHKGYGASTYLSDLIAKASPARAQHIALVIALAAVEHCTSNGTWRNAYGLTRTYFAALKTWGYDLAEVEALCLPQDDTDKSAA
jgi:ParB family chromosome partitioning protein